MNFLTKRAAATTLAFGSIFSMAGCGNGYRSGDGNQVGVISRIGLHGAWCPTTEGEMALMNIRGSGGSGSTLDFSVLDNEIAKQLKSAMEDQKAVEVTWERRSMTGLCSIESDHVITSVKEFKGGLPTQNPALGVTGNGSAANPLSPAQQLPSGKEVNLKCVPGANKTLSCAVVTP